jgi:hypothetical protein
MPHPSLRFELERSQRTTSSRDQRAVLPDERAPRLDWNDRAVEAQSWPQPSRMKLYENTDGVSWRRVGDRPLRATAARRLLRDGDVRIVRFYGMTPTPVYGAERDALTARVEDFWNGKGSVHSDFNAILLRDADHNQILAIEESS